LKTSRNAAGDLRKLLTPLTDTEKEMAKKLAMDRVLFAVVLVLLCYGSVMVYSSSSVLSMDAHGTSYSYFLKHIIIVAFSIILMTTLSGIDYKKLLSKEIIGLSLLGSLILLVFVLFLNPVNNTYRWIRFGIFSFQPSEAAKLILIIFFAYYVSRKGVNINKTWVLMPVIVIAVLFCGLIIIEPDIGTAVTIVVILSSILFVAGLKLRYFATGMIGATGIVYYLVVSSNYRMARMLAYINPWEDPLGYGFQPIQSMIAIGSGGVLGTGIAKGTQKYFYLPTPHTDFIYSVIGEELGIIGCFVLLLLFGTVLWRGMRIARRVPDDFGKLLAVGITTMIVGQAFLNISVALTLIPTKGIPLPLISFGGTSMLMTMLSVGILLNISRYTT
jgi:cell division protein FtsW